MFKMVFKTGGSRKNKKLTCNSFIFPFSSQNCPGCYTKIFIKRKPNKYLNDEYEKHFIIN